MMPGRFTAELRLPRIVFGAGTLATLADELDRLRVGRALLLSTPGHRKQAERVAESLGDRGAGVFAGAAMHVPAEIAAEARRVAGALGADSLVALGGGSTIGLAKAIALDSGLPIVAVPTTYAGSEMTPIYGITEDRLKKTGRHAGVLPRTVIYDPDLTLRLPAALSATSGMNAIAHAAEGLYAHDGNPIVGLLAQEGLRTLAAALPGLMDAPHDAALRAEALYGAGLCGAVLGQVSMGLHHKLCHTLGGSFGLPHAEVHAVVLPYALAYNAPAAPEAMRRIALALDVDDPAAGLHALAGRLGIPRSLAAIGMPADGLDEAAELAARTPYPNPRPLERAALRALLQDAYEGAPPRTR